MVIGLGVVFTIVIRPESVPIEVLELHAGRVADATVVGLYIDAKDDAWNLGEIRPNRTATSSAAWSFALDAGNSL